MNKSSLRVLFVTLTAGLLLSGCGGTTTNSSSAQSSAAASSSAASSAVISSTASSSAVVSSTVSSAPVSSESSAVSSASSTVQKVKLATPVLALNAAKTGLEWPAIEHAAKYQVSVNNGDFADATNYAFAEVAGAYSVAVKAIGDDIAYLDSEAATWTYEVKGVSLADLAVDGMTATWKATGLNTKTAFSATGQIAETDWVDIAGSTYTATASGKLGVVVSGGYDEANNVYYVGEKQTAYRWIVQAGTASKVLLDVDTEVADDVKVQEYASTGWVDSTHGSIQKTGIDLLISDTAVNFHFQNLSTAYDYAVNMPTPGESYNALSLIVKGDGISTLAIQLKGPAGYAQYTIGIPSTNWTYYVIPFADEGWTINGTSETFSHWAIANDFKSAADAIYSFTSFDMVFKSISDPKYGMTDCYLNQANLVLDTAKTTTSEPSMAEKYTGKNAAGVLLTLEATAEGMKLATLGQETNLSADLDVELVGDEVTMKTADNGASLTYVGKLVNCGEKVVFTSATGTYAPYVNNVNFNIVYTLDNFESYTETGIGWDGNHTDKTARTGLRANYYGEYYTGSGSGTSALGDKNWQMMGSADYLDLVTTAAHSGTNSAKFKRSTNTMRYVNFHLADGEGLAYPNADTFSFWAKGGAADVQAKFTMFTVKKALYFTNDTVITIPANSDWTQYTIALDATKVYYGFGMLFQGAAVSYPYFDDFELYTAANPYYVDNSPITAGITMNGDNGTVSVQAHYTVGSKVAVVATPKGGSAINLNGTYTVDASNNIVIDCGADLKYTGVLSADKTAIKYTAAEGTYGTYVNGLFLRTGIAGKTIIEDFENTTSTALVDKYTVDRDLNNTGAWTNPTDETGFIAVDETTVGSGFASGKLAMDTTAAKVGKYRYRFAQTASFGTFTNFSIKVKNSSSLPITGYFYVCTSSGTSASGRTQTKLAFSNLAANSDWQTFTGTIASATTIYGYSLFFTATASTSDVVTGFINVDDVCAW
ncbi:MAG: hypothetical protein LKJ88_05970 [Bacilli bacterium]|jgi:uncharacterized protein YceK|nr:hypothetical protein [Bacilli bacterium]